MLCNKPYKKFVDIDDLLAWHQKGNSIGQYSKRTENNRLFQRPCNFEDVSLAIVRATKDFSDNDKRLFVYAYKNRAKLRPYISDSEQMQYIMQVVRSRLTKYFYERNIIENIHASSKDIDSMKNVLIKQFVKSNYKAIESRLKLPLAEPLRSLVINTMAYNQASGFIRENISIRGLGNAEPLTVAGEIFLNERISDGLQSKKGRAI